MDCFQFEITYKHTLLQQKFFKWSPSIVYLSPHYFFIFTFSDHFGCWSKFILIWLKFFQDFDRSATVNTGKVNLTRFSETFGVFSSLSLHFVSEQSQWGIWDTQADLFGFWTWKSGSEGFFQAAPKHSGEKWQKFNTGWNLCCLFDHIEAGGQVGWSEGKKDC